MAGSAGQVIYGRNPVKEALVGCRRVRRVFVATGAGGDRLQADLEGWVATQGGRLPRVDRLDADVLAERVGTFEHQGVAAEVGPYPYVEESVLIEGVVAEEAGERAAANAPGAPTDLIVALDRVQDPHNLGAVIRVATAAGAAVVIPRHRTAVVTPAVVKASAGTTERARVAQVRNLTDFLQEAKDAGFWVYGASLSSGQMYANADYRRPLVVVLGAEGAGLGRRVEKACDLTVHIPLRGGVESLNVSVAAGILLFETLRQRGEGRAEEGKP